MKVKITELYEREEVEELGQRSLIVSICVTNDFGNPLYEFFITKSCWEAMKRREREYKKQREEKEEKEKREAVLIENLASLEHDQWCKWSKEIIKSEPISPAHKAFWESMWVPYKLVGEVCKQINRKLAREKLKLIRDSEVFWRKKDATNKRT